MSGSLFPRPISEALFSVVCSVYLGLLMCTKPYWFRTAVVNFRFYLGCNRYQTTSLLDNFWLTASRFRLRRLLLSWRIGPPRLLHGVCFWPFVYMFRTCWSGPLVWVSEICVAICLSPSYLPLDVLRPFAAPKQALLVCPVWLSIYVSVCLGESCWQLRNNWVSLEIYVREMFVCMCRRIFTSMEVQRYIKVIFIFISCLWYVYV